MEKDTKKEAKLAAKQEVKAIKEERKKRRAASKKRPRTSIAEYFRGIRTEMKKVVWPTRKELVSFTTVVIIACTFFALLFAAVDTAFLSGLKAFLGISNMGGGFSIGS